MKKLIRIFVMLTVFVLVGTSNSSAFSKVAARYNVVEFYGSSLKPIGSVDQIGIGNYEVRFVGAYDQLVEVDAEDVYDNSTQIGLNYGSLVNDKIFMGVGFSYTDIKLDKTFIANSSYQFLDLRTYNLDFNLNRYLYSPVKSSFAPYGGIGLQAGLLAASIGDYASESDFVYAIAFNFGADLNVWQAPNKMSRLNLSSVNSYQIYASESRPTYMTIGLGLKFYFRP